MNAATVDLQGVKPRRSPRSRRFDVVGALAVLGVGTFTLLAIAGPWLTPHDPSVGRLSAAYWGSDPTHLLGYDGQGRDILSRILAGARTSFLGPLLIAGVATVLGTWLALIAVWWRRSADLLVSGVVDIVLAFPGLLLAVLAASVFGVGLTAAVIALSIAYTPHMTRIVRAAASEQLSKDYVTALRVQGFSTLHISLRHLVPNLRPFILGQASVTLAWATVDIAALSFLGLGVQPPDVDWGVMVAAGQTGVLQGYPTESVAAGVCIVLAVVSFIVLGQRLAQRARGERA